MNTVTMNKHIPEKLKDYFTFLRFCLDDNAEQPECIKNIVWHDLLEFAKRQSLTSVFFHGMERLVGHENKPTDDDVLEWFGHVNDIRERNKFVYERSAWVVKNFATEGFRSCILKGQGNALLYPDIMMRMSGDIDVWVDGTPRQVIAYIRKLSPKDKVCYHHIDFSRVKKVPVEVHYRPSFMYNLVANARLQRFFKDEADRQFTNRVSLPDGMGEICVPTPAFNRIYQMSHISNHFFHEGIGLRQLVDYYLVLMQGFTADEKRNDERLLRQCGLLKMARAVMYVLHEVLGLDEQHMIVSVDKKRGKKLLDEILAGGNFGKYDERIGNNVNAGGVQKNIQRIYRDLRMAMLFPSESLWEPVFRLYHYFWRLAH